MQSKPNELIKFIYIGAYVALFGSAFVGGIAGEALRGDAGEIVAVVFMGIAMLFALVWIASALWWIWDAWSSIPEGYREFPLFGQASPAMAIGLFFVPCFNLFWIFISNIGLAESTNRALAAQGASTRVPTALVVAACVAQVIPYCNALLAPPLWFAAMFMVDKARVELGRVDAGAIAKVF